MEAELWYVCALYARRRTLMSLREIGFFRELPHGDPDGASLHEFVGRAENSEDLVRYLENGAVLAITGGALAYDVLAAESPDICPLAILTDGVWVWPSDLAYYVQNYRVKLDDDFVRHAAANGWIPPRISDSELRSLAGVELEQ
jgi:hypothetical protein